ncbi:MAG: hypothetical protein U0744_04675 [Gemmataceae bacterium]
MAQPVFESLKPALEDPHFAPDLSEEYFVFQLPPDALLLANDANWIAGLVHLDASPLSMDERDEALRLKISYSPEDLCIPDWTACALFDRDCDETLQAIEFANLQLLEFRHIDRRLDTSLAGGFKAIHLLTRACCLWRIQSRPLRVVGEQREANDLFERTGNVLELSATRTARSIAWCRIASISTNGQENIQRKLRWPRASIKMSDQASGFRMEFAVGGEGLSRPKS